MNECRNFEREMWLYLEGSLAGEKMKFWGEHLSHCDACKTLLDEASSLLVQYDNSASDDLADWQYEKMLAAAVKSNSGFQVVKNALLSFFTSAETGPVQTIKIVFGSALAVVAVVLLLLSEKPNPVKKVTSDLLDWEGKNLNSQIIELNDKIQILGDDKWNREIYSLDKKINELTTNKDKFSFN